MDVAETLEEVPIDDIERVLSDHLLLMVILIVGLIILYLFTRRIMHFVVRRTLEASAGEFEDGGITAIELDKRSRTLESLAVSLTRAAIVGAIAFLIIGFFGLWSVLTGLALLLAALTLAGQSIVLDYMMGILIIIEGTYFEGDNVSAGDPAWGIAGTVEDVGLRSTTIRGPDGTVHSISNAEMRRVSNRTRIYSAAEVRVRGIREEDLDEVLDTMNRIGKEMAEDPKFADYIMEAPKVKFLGDPDDLGWSATMRGKAMAAQRWAIGTEIRRRLNRAFLEQGLELNKRGVAPRVARSGGQPTPPYVPEPDDE
ncbi:MAG: mechanosensitive ion channel family protein [Chloroflexota bacterium]|nr:mechanosensitive ion channel family protein [Chloroflexota bacterium]